MACTVVGQQFLAWGGSDGKNIISGPPVVFDLSKDQWVNGFMARVDQEKTENSSRRRIIIFGAAAGVVLVLVACIIEYIYISKKRKKNQAELTLERQVQDRMISEGNRVNQDKSNTNLNTNNNKRKKKKNKNDNSDHPDDLTKLEQEYFCPEEIITDLQRLHFNVSRDSIQRCPHTSIDCILLGGRYPQKQPNKGRNPQARAVTPPSDDSPTTSAGQALPKTLQEEHHVNKTSYKSRHIHLLYFTM
ncbi:hypothetical protein BGZ65_002849 [Modicella reniformis]|uniref:Uncharacterized protein n=1 Tax=Modicella reniformis TaxID=1440133 RepID=A0A9P6MI96_9FUNG|nr:hypothetical protein BGZ65_002849 [Modicella reniformis]